ncbi:unnamed protein product, partial [Effrenium voratum]
YGPSQRELALHPARPRHLYRSVTDFMVDGPPPASSSVKYLNQLAMKKDAARPEAWCMWHRQHCRALRSELHVAGVICISWSPFGRCQGTDGADYSLFVSW